MTLYLKYRPKTLDDLDLTSVRDTLKNIVSTGDIPHAMLFSGPRGLGKTSAARIIAKIVNCENPSKDGEPCNKCTSCKAIDLGNHMDVFELDAASHRGIDDVRILREGVKLAPAQGKKKVYIIDEAHMLTVEAANALLKTLEEPPSHVMFILATTNPEKIIDTVRSRAVNINFTKPSMGELVRSLTKVVEGEGLKPDADFLESLAELSEGSFRDAVKKLDSLVLSGKSLSLSSLSGVSGGHEVDELLDFVFAKDGAPALKIVQGVEESGETDIFVERVVMRLRKAVLASLGAGEGKINAPDSEIVSFLTTLLTNITSMQATPIASIPLEITIAKWCMNNSDSLQGEAPEVETKKAETSKKKLDKEVPQVQPKVISTPQEDLVAPAPSLKSLDDGAWAKVLAAASPKNKSVEALLRSAKPISFDGNTLTIGVFYSFHKERLEAPTYRILMDEIVSNVFGKNIKVVCVITKPPVDQIIETKSAEGVVLAEPPREPALTTEEDKDIIKLAEEMFSN